MTSQSPARAGNHYKGMSKLRNSTLNAASFLSATAARVESGDIRLSDIVERLRACASILEQAEREATELYFQPDNAP